MEKIPRVPVEKQITTLSVVNIAIKFSPWRGEVGRYLVATRRCSARFVRWTPSLAWKCELVRENVKKATCRKKILQWAIIFLKILFLFFCFRWNANRGGETFGGGGSSLASTAVHELKLRNIENFRGVILADLNVNGDKRLIVNDVSITTIIDDECCRNLLPGFRARGWQLFFKDKLAIPATRGRWQWTGLFVK